VTISVTLSDDSSKVLVASLYKRRQLIHLSSWTRSADCDVIINIHELWWRDIEPIWSDVIYANLNDRIITLVLEENGRIRWVRHT